MEIQIDGWQKGIHFSSAHLTADLGKCERLHGHTYAIHARLEGAQGAQRIVFDFVEITRALRDIADALDHRILIPSAGEIYKVKVDDSVVKLSFRHKSYVFPKEDCLLLPTPSSTAEDLVQFVMGELRRKVRFPKTVGRLQIGVDEGLGQGAWTDWNPNGG